MDDDGKRDGRRRSGIGEVLAAAVAPGAPTLRRRPVHGVALLLAGVVAPIAWLATTIVRHSSVVALGLDRQFLAELMIVLVVVVITRLAGVGEVIASSPSSAGRRARGVAAFAALVAVIVPSAVGVAAAADARADIDRAFTADAGGPIFDATAPSPTPPPTQPPPTPAPAPGPIDQSVPTTTEHATRQAPHEVIRLDDGSPSSGVDPALLTDVSTILLLGGDAGPGRSGLRTDSMILVSIHRPSGRAALISFPRNAERILFPPGTFLAEQFPNGYYDIANAVYTRVANNPEWRAPYEVEGLRPGAIAISQAIGYSLDVTIDDYVLIDMRGFLEVIDALGGVTIDVPKAVPAPGNPSGAKHDMPDYISAGVQHMDGTTALAYVRSRKSDTDYHRMRRQRDLLGALAGQVSLTDALTGYTRITAALGDSLHTSLTAEEFTNLLALLGGETAIVESVGLAPPLIDPSRPNYDDMAKIVGRVRLALVVGEPSGY